MNTMRESNNLIPDLSQHDVQPNLGSKHLQRLSVDNKSHH